MYNVLKFSENDKIMSKNQFTGTATQPQRNRKFCQFNKDQYCNKSPYVQYCTFGHTEMSSKTQPGSATSSSGSARPLSTAFNSHSFREPMWLYDWHWVTPIHLLAQVASPIPVRFSTVYPYRRLFKWSLLKFMAIHANAIDGMMKRKRKYLIYFCIISTKSEPNQMSCLVVPWTQYVRR